MSSSWCSSDFLLSFPLTDLGGRSQTSTTSLVCVCVCVGGGDLSVVLSPSVLNKGILRKPVFGRVGCVGR